MATSSGTEMTTIADYKRALAMANTRFREYEEEVGQLRRALIDADNQRLAEAQGTLQKKTTKKKGSVGFLAPAVKARLEKAGLLTSATPGEDEVNGALSRLLDAWEAVDETSPSVTPTMPLAPRGPSSPNPPTARPDLSSASPPHSALPADALLQLVHFFTPALKQAYFLITTYTPPPDAFDDPRYFDARAYFMALVRHIGQCGDMMGRGLRPEGWGVDDEREAEAYEYRSDQAEGSRATEEGTCETRANEA